MKTKFINANILDSTTRAFFTGSVTVDTDTGTVLCVTAGDNTPDASCETVDVGGAYLIPGLVDVHTHGRAGGDFGSAEEGMLRRMAASYLASGVTAVMPTLASAPLDGLYAAIDRIHGVKTATGGARFVGIHLEGRYLNPTKRGAHAPELLFPLDAGELTGLLERMCTPAHVSAALELDGDGSFARAALSGGATLSLGHTAATYDEATLAFSRGATAVTHLYNCMPQLHHRDGGAVCAALTGNVFCEVICDGFHISAPMVDMAYRLATSERFVLITDSMEATDCPDGEYSIAGMPVTVKDGKAVTHDGAIAGSTLSLFDGVKNLMKFTGASFADAVICATRNPAKEVGVYDTLGSVTPGKTADFLTVDPETLTLRAVYLGGTRMY